MESDQTRAEKWTPRARQAGRQAGFWTPPFPTARGGSPSSNFSRTHLLLRKLWELTQDHRSEEKQQFPPGFPLDAHYSYNPDATCAATPMGTALRSTALGWTLAARLSPARLSLHARWAVPSFPAFRLVKREGAPKSDSPYAGATPNFSSLLSPIGGFHL